MHEMLKSKVFSKENVERFRTEWINFHFIPYSIQTIIFY